MIDPERIWLQNANDARATGDRLWCQDKVWPECAEQQEPTEYIRADLYACCISHQDAELERVRREVEEFKALFEQRWNTDLRAKKRWQDANPDKPNIWPSRDDLLVWLMEQHAEARKAAFTEAAEIAETFGVYPELNVFAGGPEWYKHGKAIATALRAKAEGRP